MFFLVYKLYMAAGMPPLLCRRSSL